MTTALECLVNQQRVRFGLPPLRVSLKLDRAAQQWSDHLVASNQFLHGDVSGRMTAVGYDWDEGGEDLGGGYLTPRDMLSGWMGSYEHCQNILWPDYRDMGTGENAGGSGPATWTMDFGLTMNERQLSSKYSAANACPYDVPASPYPGSSTGDGSDPSGSGSWPTTPCDTPDGCPTPTTPTSSSGSPGTTSTSGSGWPTTPCDTPSGACTPPG